MRTFSYAILRHGSNRANQSLIQESVIGGIEATSHKQAEIALKERGLLLHCYNNQYLSVESVSSLAKRWGYPREEIEQYIWEAEQNLIETKAWDAEIRKEFA